MCSSIILGFLICMVCELYKALRSLLGHENFRHNLGVRIWESRRRSTISRWYVQTGYAVLHRLYKFLCYLSMTQEQATLIYYTPQA